MNVCLLEVDDLTSIRLFYMSLNTIGLTEPAHFHISLEIILHLIRDRPTPKAIWYIIPLTLFSFEAEKLKVDLSISNSTLRTAVTC